MKTKADIKIGEFQKFMHPDYAESHTLSDYTTRFYKDSALVPGVRVLDYEEFKCPGCGKISEFPQEHGDAYECGNCGLRRQSFGNGLHLWREKEPVPKKCFLCGTLQYEPKYELQACGSGMRESLLYELKNIIHFLEQASWDDNITYDLFGKLKIQIKKL